MICYKFSLFFSFFIYLFVFPAKVETDPSYEILICLWLHSDQGLCVLSEEGSPYASLLPSCFVLKIWLSISVLLAFRVVEVFVPPRLDPVEVVCLRTLGLWS